MPTDHRISPLVRYRRGVTVIPAFGMLALLLFFAHAFAARQFIG